MSRQIREIRVIDIFTYAALPLLAILLIWLAGTLVPIVGFDMTLPWWVYLLYGLATYVLLHPFAIGLVLIYKAFAPMDIRRKCRFEPTCSTYMIIAIKKYGLIFGVIKGIRRLLRCQPPNGGVDYP